MAIDANARMTTNDSDRRITTWGQLLRFKPNSQLSKLPAGQDKAGTARVFAIVPPISGGVHKLQLLSLAFLPLESLDYWTLWVGGADFRPLLTLVN